MIHSSESVHPKQTPLSYVALEILILLWIFSSKADPGICSSPYVEFIY